MQSQKKIGEENSAFLLEAINKVVDVVTPSNITRVRKIQFQILNTFKGTGHLIFYSFILSMGSFWSQLFTLKL